MATLRLSEAILAGSTLIKWEAGDVFTRDGAGCAIGMGLAAHGFTHATFDVSDPEEVNPEDVLWPWLSVRHRGLSAPCNCDYVAPHEFSTYWYVIAHLFDKHVMPNRGLLPRVFPTGTTPWTLEQLVDYVRSIEPAEAPSCAEPAATCTDAVSVGVA